VVFESWYSPARSRDGTVDGVIGVGTNITERRRAEEALRRSEESTPRAGTARLPCDLPLLARRPGRHLDAVRQTTGVRLVLSDLVMPRLGGRGLYTRRAARARPCPSCLRAGTRPQTERRASIPRSRCSTSRGRRRICWDGCERFWIGKPTRRAEGRVEARRSPERFRFTWRPLVPRCATRRALLSPSAPGSQAQTASAKTPPRS
jgi:PAS domain-containing protein